MTRRHRVVVTGMGAVTPLGLGVASLVEGLRSGRSGVGPITVFDASMLPTRIAGEVKEALPSPFRDRKVGFALEAARQAWDDACSPGTAPFGHDASVVMGVGLELFSMVDLVASRRPGFEHPSGFAERVGFMQTPSDVCVHLLASLHGAHRPPAVLVSACAAGSDALGQGYRLIASGRRRWVMAGGTDSMVNPLGVAGFCTLSATSTRNDEPTKASRPFERTRDGFVMGEGAGVVILERLEDALARGRTPLAQIVGYGTSFDAHGISEPHPEGRGAHDAMVRALKDAGLEPGSIDSVNAHGTGTQKNDPAESRALLALLGDRAPKVPVSATKSMIGHLISAAGAVEAIAQIGCMRGGFVHPTINLDEPDPACPLDYVSHVARAHPQRHSLSTSYGFGGQNAALVLRVDPGFLP